MSVGFLIVIIVTAVVLLTLINLLNKSTPKCVDKIHFKNEWQDIVIMSKDEKSATMSVIQADKVLDEALKCFGFTGNTMAERLVSAKNKLKHRDDIWQAHKLRNKIAHDPNFNAPKKTIIHALKAYARALKDLGAM